MGGNKQMDYVGGFHGVVLTQPPKNIGRKFSKTSLYKLTKLKTILLQGKIGT